jgi:hypothetical protein
VALSAEAGTLRAGALVMKNTVRLIEKLPPIRRADLQLTRVTCPETF